MYIDNRKTRNGKIIFIFNFIDEEEFHAVISNLRAMANDMYSKKEDEDRRENLLGLIGKLESRTDGRYANEETGTALSGMLFADEMSRFTTDCLLFATVYFSCWSDIKRKI